MSQTKPATDAPAQGQVAKRDPAQNVQALLAAQRKQIELALPRHMSPDRMLRIALTETRKNPDLLTCEPMSFLGAVIQAAQLGLEPGSGLGHAFLVPFNNKRRGIKEVVMIPGYKGLIDLARRSGKISTIAARLVYERDRFEFVQGDEERITHVPSADADRGKITWCYAIAKLSDGGIQREVMSRAQLDAHCARFSKGNPVWDTDFDEMCRKTLVRRICKYLPMSPELARAIEIEDREDGQGNWAVIDAAYEPKPAEHDPEKIKAAIANAGAVPAGDPRVEADRRNALVLLGKAIAEVAAKGANPDELLGMPQEDIYQLPTDHIFALVDKLAAWRPKK